MLVPCSSPLTSETTGTQGRNSLLSSVSTPRKPCEGTPITTTSAQLAASAKSVVARNVSLSWTSLPRYRELWWFSLMSLAVASERTHCSVGPRRAQIDATVVPQEPPPRTTTLGSRFSAAMELSVLPNAAEHHRLLDAVELVVDGVGEVVLPHVPRAPGAGLGQRVQRPLHIVRLDVPRRLLGH